MKKYMIQWGSLGAGLFFMPKFPGKKMIVPGQRCHGQNTTLSMRNEKTEVEVVRVKITLACTDCKQRNYNMTKEKKNHPDRMETKKYCKFCKAHTMHKETK